MKQIRSAGRSCGGKVIQMFKKHPVMGSAALFLAVPVGILAGISTITAAVSVPVAMVLGWM